ncbi:pilus assembly protein [Corallococcus sp. M34]|uniref:type IV pilus modification PilV family protein n=1 Tax=Citreicoccus inhibens TaxID=2849499 RepID=UPI001C23C363|nr:pilus assembly protein [Citreicoccus inhibens]MBU8896357.1 pilus assembly protein [Citreicoccus inhibens]
MTSLHRHAPRGATLLEVMATMAVLLLGIAAAMTVVAATSRSNRRTLTAIQAQLIAEQYLENITAQGCNPVPPACSNLAAWDRRRDLVYQTAGGQLTTTAPGPGVTARQYEVSVDVDGPTLTGSIENGSQGEPSISRPLVGTNTGNLVNVRVSVSWEELGSRNGRQVVVVQTRMAP